MRADPGDPRRDAAHQHRRGIGRPAARARRRRPRRRAPRAPRPGWPSGSSTVAGRVRPRARRAPPPRCSRAATRIASRTSGVEQPGRRRDRLRVDPERLRRLASSKRLGDLAQPARHRARTLPRSRSTSAVTSPSAGASARSRPANAARVGAVPSRCARPSLGGRLPQPLGQRVHLRRPQLVGDAVGDQAGRAARRSPRAPRARSRPGSSRCRRGRRSRRRARPAAPARPTP